MKTALKVLVVVILVALVFIVLWAFVPANIEENLAANVKVITGPVEIKAPAATNWVEVKSLGSLPPGASLRVGKGGEAFVGYFDGGLSRIVGPTELKVVESRREIKGRSFLGGMIVKLLGKEPTGKTQVKSRLVLELVSGEVVSRKGSPPSADSIVLVKGPQTVAIATGASFRMNVTPGEGSWWESVEGNTALGMVSVQADTAAAIVIPQLPPGTRILVPGVPQEFQASPKIPELLAGVDSALSVLRTAQATTRVDSTDYALSTEDPRLPYFLGPEVALVPKAPPPPKPPKPQKAATAPVPAETFNVPGAETQVFTEADIAPNLPEGSQVRFVPGNVVEVTYLGAVYAVRVNVTAGKVEFAGLPFGFDPGPYIEKYVEKIPVVLSLETKDGALAVSYLPDKPLAEEPPEEPAAEPPPLPRSTPYFVSIASPEEISTDWTVAVTNGAFVAYAALLIRVITSLINSIFRSHEETATRLASRVTRFGVALARGPRAVASALSHVPLYGLFRVLVLLLLYGLIFSFLDPRFRPWEGKGLGILPLITFSTALVSLVDPVTRSIVLSRWRMPHSLGVYPANLALAVVSVGVSRGLRFSPGFLMGTPGGLKVSGLKDAQKFTLLLTSLTVVLVVGFIAWGIAFLLPKLMAPESGLLFLRALKGPLTFLRDVSLVIFAVAITRTFFGLLPLPGGNGAFLWGRSKVLWLAFFGVSAFVFLHALGNKGSSMNKLIADHGPVVFSFLGASLLVALGLLAFARLTRPKAKVQPAATGSAPKS